MTSLVALGFVFVLAATVVLLSAEQMRRRERAWERRELSWQTERNDLLNRVMFLTDRTWALPPADIQPRDFMPEEEDDEIVQDPMYYLPNEIV